MATDTTRTTENSNWGKSREGETKPVKFKTLSQSTMRQRWRAVVACSRCGLRIPEKRESRPEVNQTAGTIRSSEVEDRSLWTLPHRPNIDNVRFFDFVRADCLFMMSRESDSHAYVYS